MPSHPVQGIGCPSENCNSRALRVLYTRKRLGKIVRVRECPKCGRRVVTAEAITSNDIGKRKA
jgi:transcriptional regulator NrdR family protein